MTDTTPATPDVPMRLVVDSHHADGVLMSLPIDLIDVSPYNPRGPIDITTEEFKEFAASIKEQGLLQPIVLRTAGAERYELIFGHRRLAALKLNGADRAPCILRSIEDVGSIRALQIIENLQRANVAPLEEAEAFVSLQAEDPERWTAAEIGRKIGKSDRYVAQRMAIARGLAEPLKKRLAKGELPLEVARTLAPLPASLQASLQKHWSLERNNVDIDNVRRGIFEFAVPVENAKFDTALYDGEILAEGKRKFFTDLDKFRALQTVEAEKVLAKVKEEWPKASLVTAATAHKMCWADESYGASLQHSARVNDRASKFVVPREKCTAVVWIAQNGRIHKAEGVCSEAVLGAIRQARAAKDAASNKERFKPEPKAHKVAREDYIRRLSTAIAADPATLRRLELLIVLRSGGIGNFSPDYDDAKKLEKEVLPAPLLELTHGAYNALDKTKDAQAAWDALCTVDGETANDIIAQLMAGRIGWSAYQWKKAPALALAIGATLGVAPNLPEETKAAKPKAEKKAKVDKAKAPAKAKAKTKAKPKAKKKTAPPTEAHDPSVADYRDTSPASPGRDSEGDDATDRSEAA